MIIRHLTGPLAGKEQELDPRVDRITFGRDPLACDVVFPPDLTLVARRHFALIRLPEGIWTVDLFGDPYVAVNGVSAEDSAPVHSGSVFELGKRGGPSFEVIIHDDLHALAPTTLQQKALSERMAPSRSSGFAKAAGVGLVAAGGAAAVVVGGLPAVAVVAAAGGAVIAAGAAVAGAGWVFKKLTKPGSARESTRSSYDPREEAPPRHALEPAPDDKALPPATVAPPSPGADVVEVSAFAPSRATPATEFLVQVFLHKSEEAAQVGVMAREVDPAAVRRGNAALNEEIRSGQRIDVILEAPGFGIDDPAQFVVWRGASCTCQFLVSVPHDVEWRAHFLRVRVMVDSIAVGTLRFAVRVAVSREEVNKAQTEARRFARAFVSYASGDRLEVLKRTQGLRAARIEFFQDLLSLDPGDRWERRLFEEIDRCDLFLLFWSSKAAASEWVIREAEYALARAHSSSDDTPFIQPIMLEGPPPPEPPESLRHIHFNDELRYLMAAIEAQGRRESDRRNA